ncbi:MAG: oligosaccharyl transferase, archaeosortase A system-associated, partial [Dehalococcoidales bacterium]|nr:oligosaccharyl transferase, archaeosortase A system-associated [Dehalococcoidales bacterium]
MNISKLPLKLIIGISLAIFIGVSLWLRIYLPYDQIFTNGWIKFSSNDAYYYMRIIDNLAHNFPHLNGYDPYLIYPGGSAIGSIVFFGWFVSGIIWLISFGSPSQHTIDVVAAYYPAVLAALTIIPTYFIGKNLFGRGAGIIAAALIAIMPGEFMGRSILGFTDHHVAETLFSTLVMLFLILAIKSAGENKLTFEHLKKQDWAASRRTMLYALLAGISLGVYLLTWIGGLLFVFIITLYLIIQFIIDNLRRRSTDYLAIVSIIAFLVALVMVAPFSPPRLNLASMILALLVPVILLAVSRLMTSRQLSPAYYPLALIGIGAAGLGILYAVAPALVRNMLDQFSMFTPSGPSTTTLEMQHLSWYLAWGNFTTGFLFALAGLTVLLFLVVFKKGGTEKTLIVIWSVIIFAATLAQRRFAYYFAVNVSLLTAYICWQIIWLFSARRLAAAPAVAVPERTRDKHAKSKPKGKGLTVYHMNTALAIIVVFIFAIVFDIKPAIATAKQVQFAPSDGWYNALLWLKDNSPEPFGDANAYYKSPVNSNPDSAYGVTAWWDYGYWITRIAHRLPSSNPSQDPDRIINVTHVFLAQDEARGEEAMQKLRSSYIIMDYPMAAFKFWAVITWAGQPLTNYFEDYYLPQQRVTVRAYYPDYYRSLAIRLYNFDGKAVTPTNTIVITWEEQQNKNG